jgi:hypothetical protein
VIVWNRTRKRDAWALRLISVIPPSYDSFSWAIMRRPPAMICPNCESTRVRPLLPMTTDDRPTYDCRDCGSKWQIDRRKEIQATLRTERRSANMKTKRLA